MSTNVNNDVWILVPRKRKVDKKEKIANPKAKETRNVSFALKSEVKLQDEDRGPAPSAEMHVSTLDVPSFTVG